MSDSGGGGPKIPERRVLVCGSRQWNDKDRVFQELDRVWLQTGGAIRIIHGGCPSGADDHARLFCLLGFQSTVFPADWSRYGRAAGMIRNEAMLVQGKPNLVLAFRAAGASPGTDDMVRRARKAGIEVRVIHEGRADDG